MSDHADVAPRLIHTSALLPGVRDGVIAPDRVEVIAAVETADHVDQVVQCTETVVGARGQVHVDGEEPPVGPFTKTRGVMDLCCIQSNCRQKHYKKKLKVTKKTWKRK